MARPGKIPLSKSMYAMSDIELEEEIDALEQRVETLERAIDWVCGAEGSDFYSEYERMQRGLPRYWWREELRNRVG